MQILSGESKAGAEYPEAIMADMPKVVDLFDVLTKVFFLNQEDRFKAGIYFGYKGRDWINQVGLLDSPVIEEEIPLS